MYGDNKPTKKGFPSPLETREVKESNSYGLQYAKAIENQWGTLDRENTLMRRRRDTFLKNRAYSNGTQDTAIYRQLLTSMDPNNGDGSFLNLDFTPVPILPKFARIVVKPGSCRPSLFF